MGQKWDEHTKNFRKAVVVLMSLFLLLSGAAGAEDFYQEGCACVCVQAGEAGAVISQ